MSKSIKLQDDTFLDSTGIVHNKELLSEILTHITTDINRTDLDDYTTSFTVGYGHNLTNTPTSMDIGFLLSIPRHDTEGFVVQYFSPYQTNDVYIRKCTDGTWEAWQQISSDTGNKSYAKMHTNGQITYSDLTTVTDWGTEYNISIGDFVCQPQKNRIYIPKGSAEYIRVMGSVAGNNNIMSYLTLEDDNGLVDQEVFNHQPQGNKYFNLPAWNTVYKLDPTKDYYLYLRIMGYNGASFGMNNGYRDHTTFIAVEKIK